MRLFAFVIFLSAFLLFQVQPMIAKVILPWFGSSAGVWTACMMFFQSALLLGYSYAHGVVRTFSWRRQAMFHGGLLAVSLLALPIMPSEFWKPSEAGDPTWRIVLMLLVCVGGPYVMLSATGPLLQRWFGVLQPGKSPYRLFALSNAGSLVGLLTYPFLFEPQLTLQAQTAYWSVAYGVFALGCGAVALLVWRSPASSPESIACDSPSPAPPAGSAQLSVRQVLMWLALSACGSVMLLAVTNLLCQDVAAVPMLWVAPLSVYLLTFIIAFDSPRWYFRPILLPAILIGAAFLLWAAIDPVGLAAAFRFAIPQPVWVLVLIFSGGLFVICLGCHGELARIKPHPSRLTTYYLCISAGGALGGLFVGMLAPQLFLGYWEFPIAIVLSVALIGVAAASEPGQRNGFLQFLDRLREPEWRAAISRKPFLWQPFWLAGLLGILALAPFTDPMFSDYLVGGRTFQDLVEVRRNFYGVWRTTDWYGVPQGGSRPIGQRNLVHGRILHGYQFTTGNLRREKTSYYGERSGLGLALTWHPRRNPENEQVFSGGPLRIGVIGLGTGSVAAYGISGDALRFYEINPQIAETAEDSFYYLRDARNAGAEVELALGDARLLLEREADQGDLQQFDVLVVDAFSGDSIPMHLLTKECYNLYWRHLKPDGILVIHISNDYLDLEQVVRGLAQTDHKRSLRVAFARSQFVRDEQFRLKASVWMLVTSNQEFIERMVGDTPAPAPGERPVVLWTDDYSSLLPVLRTRTVQPPDTSSSPDGNHPDHQHKD